MQGDWANAMRLLQRRRAELADYYRRIADSGFRTYRVRVVVEPLTPYLCWELQLLRLRSDFGAGMRVVREDQVAQFESSGPFPELCVLGEDAVYNVLYDTDGALAGGIRYRDRELISQYRDFIQSLYEDGEDLATYVDRSDSTPDNVTIQSESETCRK